MVTNTAVRQGLAETTLMRFEGGTGHGDPLSRSGGDSRAGFRYRSGRVAWPRWRLAAGGPRRSRRRRVLRWTAAVSESSVEAGSSVRVAGELVDDRDQGQAGTPVVLDARTSPDSAWNEIAHLTTDSEGKVATELVVERGTWVRWRQPGAIAGRTDVLSSEVRVEAQPVITLSAPGSWVVVGDAITVSGSVAPPEAGSMIVLLERDAGTTTELATTTAAADGAFDFPLTADRRTELAARRPADETWAAAQSPWVTIAPKSVVHGTVTREIDGRPEPSVALLLFTASGDRQPLVQTGHDGTYRLVAEPGDWFLQWCLKRDPARSAGFTCWYAPQEVEAGRSI